MFRFTNRDKGLTDADLERSLEHAIELLYSGDVVAAEKEIHSTVERASEGGTSTPIYARALFNEATVLMGIGDLNGAIERCKEAAGIRFKSEKGNKDRLTYSMNLGEMLTRANRLEEAEEVLRSGLKEREALYGRDHAGYAYGLGSLAELLLARGKAFEALPLIDRALYIYAPIAHEQFAPDLALRAYIAKAAGGAKAEGFWGWDELPTETKRQVAKHAVERADRVDPAIGLLVLHELSLRIEHDPDMAKAELLNATVALSNRARAAGDLETTIAAARTIIDIARAARDSTMTANGLEGLALALSEIGRVDEAEAAYERAVGEAESAGNLCAAANALRNAAIWSDERGQRDRARVLHKRSVEVAKSTNDARLEGRASCAFGIFLQHQDEPVAAAAHLRRALRLLAADDPDAFFAQNHLLSIQHGTECDCSANADESLSNLVERLVMERAPDGLIRGIKVHLGDDGMSVDVDALRPLSSDEADEVNRLIKVSLAQMREKYRRVGNVT